MGRALILGASVVAVVVLAVRAPAADGANAPHVQQRIVPGQSIGNVALGMTLKQVRKALGAPQSVQRRTELGFGRQYVEYAWNYGAWVVGLEGRQGSFRVVRVATSLSTQRTATGVGPGSGIRAIVKSYPSATCVDRWRLDPYPGRWIVVAPPSGRMTVFEIISFGGTYEASKPDRVAAVLIQSRWLSRSQYDTECADGWRSR